MPSSNEGIVMLINSQGKDVSNAITKMARDNPKVYHKNREHILVNLREILLPNNHHQGTMFQLGERARMV